MSDPIRLVALKALQTRIAGMQAGVNGYFLAFTNVVLGPLDAQEAGRKRAMCGIVPGKEVVDIEFPLTYAKLAVDIEFRVTWNTGDRPSQELAEVVLGDLKRKVLEDQSLGGVVVDMKEMGSEITLDLFSDKVIAGVLFYDLLYRYNTLDPRQPI